MCRDHLRGFGLLGDAILRSHNRPTPALQYRTQRGIPVPLKPLILRRPTARSTTSLSFRLQRKTRPNELHDRPTLAPKVKRRSSSCANVSTIASAAPVPAASRASFEG